jgi:hypothetical protein
LARQVGIAGSPGYPADWFAMPPFDTRQGTNAFDPYGLAYRRRGSALKYDFAANYRYVGLDVLDLILRHGHVVRREYH